MEAQGSGRHEQEVEAKGHAHDRLVLCSLRDIRGKLLIWVWLRLGGIKKGGKEIKLAKRVFSSIFLELSLEDCDLCGQLGDNRVTVDDGCGLLGDGLVARLKFESRCF